VRELLGVVESMVILARGRRLTTENVPYEIRKLSEHKPEPLHTAGATLAEIEKRVILETLERYEGHRTKTADTLGIGRRTLIRKLHEYGVSRAGEDEE